MIFWERTSLCGTCRIIICSTIIAANARITRRNSGASLKVHRIVIAIAIQVQAVGGIGVKVCGIIGRDEAAPFGGIVPGVAVVETGVVIVVITAITDRIGIGYGIVGGFVGNGAITPSVEFTS